MQVITFLRYISFSERASSLNKTNLWSLSGTGIFLTSYAEGLLCDNLSRSSQYIVCKASRNKWYAMYKYEEESPHDNKATPKFRRVRVIERDLNCLNCSCGYVQNMLLPCSHICAVIHFMGSECTLENIHYRWYGHHAYQHATHINQDNADNQASAVEPWIQKLTIVRSFFDSSFCQITGRYRGCPLSVEQETACFSKETMITETILPEIKMVLDYNWSHGPMVTTPTNVDVSDGIVHFTQEEYVHTKISVAVRSRNNQIAESKANAWCNLSKEMVRPIMRRFLEYAENMDDFSWLENSIEEFVMSKETKKNKKQTFDSSMIGSTITNKRIVRRHRFPGEGH